MLVPLAQVWKSANRHAGGDSAITAAQPEGEAGKCKKFRQIQHFRARGRPGNRLEKRFCIAEKNTAFVWQSLRV
jgi:hypothetical protein